MGYLAFPLSGWVLTALAETPIQLLALTPIGNHSLEKEPGCSRIYLRKFKPFFEVEWESEVSPSQ